MASKGRKAATSRDGTVAFIKRVADALLAGADRYVPDWFPEGRRDGHEWKVGGLSGARGKSLSINLHTGVWKDFAAGDGGADLVALYAAKHGTAMGDAARDLADRYGFGSPDAAVGPPPAQPTSRKRTEWRPIVPVPAEAPDYRTGWGHYARGVPARHWEYRGGPDGALLGVVCRFETSDGGKEILPLTWCENDRGARAWRYVAFPEPRPMYGLPRLAGPVDRVVVIVEGEKCADALHELLEGSLPVLAWPGGANGIGKVDWSPLAGRRVVLWPDHDRQVDKRTGAVKPPHLQPGIAAMEGIAERILPMGCEVRIVDLSELTDTPDGWDVADAIAMGWTRDSVRDFLRRCLRAPGALAPTSAARAEGEVAPIERELEPQGAEHPEWMLVRKRGELVPCTQNVYALLMRNTDWHGVIAFDEFAQRIVKLRAPPFAGMATAGEWEGTDDSRTAMWLATHEGFTPSSAIVAETVEVVAREHAFHPVRSYLEAIAWDGTARIDDWLTDLLGASGNEYTRLVGRFFLIGLVKRVMEPGCKFDYCLVLEGRQGMFKSSALRVLGGPWFKDTDLDLQNKDAMTALQGAWLYEIAEMDSLTRAEASKQKSFLSRQVDEFRPVYGRREVRLPRQVCFAGTTNSWEWNKDPTGGRRFWPVEVTEVDLHGLAAQRDQLFAEALAEYRRGAACYPDKDQQRELFDPEQLARQQSEGYVDALHDWVFSRTGDFSMAEAVKDGLQMDYSKLTRDVQTRVGNALKALGCTRVERRNGMVRFWYRPPTRKVASSGTPHAQQDSGGAHEPLPI